MWHGWGMEGRLTENEAGDSSGTRLENQAKEPRLDPMGNMKPPKREPVCSVWVSAQFHFLMSVCISFAILEIIVSYLMARFTFDSPLHDAHV